MKLELDINSTQNSSSVNNYSSGNGYNSEPDNVTDMLRSGIKLAKEGNRAEARQVLLRVTESESNNETAWLWLASISEYPEELLVFLQNVLSINPTNERALEWAKATKSLLSKTFVQRGINASHENQKEFAKQCFLQAIVHDAANEMAWLWLASASDSTEEKVSHLQKVLNINPENETALSSLKAVRNQMSQALLKKANSAAIAGERESARQMLDEIMRQTPELEEAWILQAYLVDGFYAKIECYEKVLALNPENEAAQAGLASLKAIMQKTAELKPEILRQPDEISAQKEVLNAVEEASATSQDLEFSQNPEHSQASESSQNLEISRESEPSPEYLPETAPEQIDELTDEFNAPQDSSFDFAQESNDAFTHQTDVEFNEKVTENSQESTVEFAEPAEFNQPAENTFSEMPSVENKTDNYLFDYSETSQNESEEYLIDDTAVPNASFDTAAKDENYLTDEESHNTDLSYQEDEVFAEENEIQPAASFEPKEIPTQELKEEPVQELEHQTLNSIESENTFEEVQSVSQEVSPNLEINEDKKAEPMPESENEVSDIPTQNEYFAQPAHNEDFTPSHDSEHEFQAVSEFVQETPASVELRSEVYELNHLTDKYEEVNNFQNVAETAEVNNFQPAAGADHVSAETVLENNYVAEQPAMNEEFFSEKSEVESEDILNAESFDFQEEAAPTAVIFNCPFCNAENEQQSIICHSCRAMLSLSDLEMLLAHQEANQDVILQAVEKLEIEKNLHEFNADELQSLGIAHLNAKNLRKGFACLQEAVQLNPNDVVLSAKVNFLAIRLSEIEAQENKAQEHPVVCKTIMVVDDSPTVRKLITGKLEKSGHSVITAIDGMDALAKINEFIPDLILLDITMPRLDGYQVCKLIRNNEVTKDVPIVMISGKDGFFDKVRGRMAGSSGYITKPFGPDTLMKTIETYIN